MNEKKLRRNITRESILGYILIAMPVCIAIGLIILAVSGDTLPSDSGYLRAAIVLPFALIYGVKALRKAKSLKVELERLIRNNE